MILGEESINETSEERYDELITLRISFLLGLFKSFPLPLLDYGCGDGKFLLALKKYLYPSLSSKIPQLYGLDFISEYPEDIKEYGGEPLFLTTFYHSLEYIKEPADLIKYLPTKYILVTVYNCWNMANKDWFLTWKHEKADKAYSCFSKRILKDFFDYCGYYEIVTSDCEDIIEPRDHAYAPNTITALYISKLYALEQSFNPPELRVKIQENLK